MRTRRKKGLLPSRSRRRGGGGGGGGALALLALLVCGGGCAPVSEGGIDSAFLQKPGAKPVAEATTIPDLFPAQAGLRWPMLVREDEAAFREEIRSLGPRRVGNVAGMLREIRRNGTVHRQEVYRVSPQELSLVAVGAKANMVLTPPMPLLAAPVAEGKGVFWEGTILTGRQEVPARAFSRLTMRETVKTPAGAFQAYRVDTNLTAFVEGSGAVHFPATRWFVPGIGIVREKFLSGEKVVQKELERRDAK